MTDYEMFIGAYTSAGIKFKTKKHTYEDDDGNDYEGNCIQLVVPSPMLGEEEPTNIIGFGGFYTSIFFDKDGKLFAQGLWE